MKTPLIKDQNLIIAACAVIIASFLLLTFPGQKQSSSPAWKTYQSDYFTFQYPSVWQGKKVIFADSPSDQISSLPDEFVLYVSTLPNIPPFADIDEYIGMPYQTNPLVVDGRQGRQPLPRAGSENYNRAVFFSLDSNSIYTIDLKSGDTTMNTSQAHVETGQDLFAQILSTLQFLDSTCLGQSKRGNYFTNHRDCCPGLTQIACTGDGPFYFIMTNGCYLCSACPNGQCDSGENPGNCPQDCQ